MARVITPNYISVKIREVSSSKENFFKFEINLFVLSLSLSRISKYEKFGRHNMRDI